MQPLDFVNNVLMYDALAVNPDKALALGQIIIALDLKLVCSVGSFIMGGGGIREPPKVNAPSAETGEVDLVD